MASFIGQIGFPRIEPRMLRQTEGGAGAMLDAYAAANYPAQPAPTPIYNAVFTPTPTFTPNSHHG